MRSIRVAGLVMLLVGSTTTMASAATTRLASRLAMGNGVERLSYRYGPLEAAPGQNLILMGPVTIEKPPGGSYVVRIQASLVDAAGKTPPVEQVHMHHAVFLNAAKADASDHTVPERFFAFAEEKTIATLPTGYGYLIDPTDVWTINYMLHNETPADRQVFLTYTIDVVPKASPAGQKMIPVHPLWMDIRNGSAYPVFDVHRGSGKRGRFTFPDDAKPSPYAPGAALNEWRADHDLTLVATAGHVHPGGLWTDLDLQRGARRAHLFRSVARYFDPNGPVSWDMAMTFTPSRWRVGVRKGDVLKVNTTYETKRASWYESMGIMVIYYADRRGPDPFRNPPPTTGAITHGPLPEAQNHGGEPTSLPDPAKLNTMGTLADGVAIANFAYTPGDLSAADATRGVPVVAQGGQLRFGNFDAAASIFHTITSCRLPCNRATGVSYPLANGPVRFDSAELGYGPGNLSAAANRADWSTPKDLKPGTYAYFCRIHPFMRGAFRVAGQ